MSATVTEADLDAAEAQFLAIETYVAVDAACRELDNDADVNTERTRLKRSIVQAIAEARARAENEARSIIADMLLCLRADSEQQTRMRAQRWLDAIAARRAK